MASRSSRDGFMRFLKCNTFGAFFGKKVPSYGRYRMGVTIDSNERNLPVVMIGLFQFWSQRERRCGESV
jgi:hypothetical protein